MNSLYRVLSLAMCGMFAGCFASSSEELTAAQEAEIAETLLSITETYNAVWEELDLERISEYHADDFTYYRRGVVQSASQTEFERAYHDDVATQITAYWADATDTWVEVLGPNSGIVAFVFRGGVETPDGGEFDYDGALTYVYEQRDDEWKIVHIHESAYLPESP